VVRTKEPDGGRLGRDVRAMLTKERDFSLDAVEELLLVAVSRYDHVRSVIRPALDAGDWVLSDRFVDSTFALQVIAAGAQQDLFNAVNAVVADETRPDMTFILDLPPDKALARRADRSGRVPGDPAESTRNVERIRSGFRQIACAEPKRCKLIDARKDEAAVAAAIRAELLQAGLLSA
jgi:dTMP kinase